MKHLRPRKALGQSFLTYEPVADELVAALGVRPGDTVLEVGPGKGMLTRRLVTLAAKVIAVEIDERLAEGLRAEMQGGRNLEVVQADFMGFDLRSLRHLKVMGNLPYNLSSQILFRLLESLEAWDVAVLTTQREFAYRVVALPGSKAYGALSVFFDRMVLRERLFNIRPESFKPRPDVVSTSFRLTRREQPLYDVPDEELFRRVVKVCFAQRRKTIANNLVAGLSLTRDAAVACLERAGIQPAARAEVLSGEQFKKLTDALSEEGFQGPRVQGFRPLLSDRDRGGQPSDP
ncbi:ribosomal RNA small subunit methyltransferase A [candidate division WOR-3 bacterium]|nr:ribosomal RNA small subunit methyltransferase A [candidate division WOR-3 bacterium]